MNILCRQQGFLPLGNDEIAQVEQCEREQDQRKVGALQCGPDRIQVRAPQDPPDQAGGKTLPWREEAGFFSFRDGQGKRGTGGGVTIAKSAPDRYVSGGC